MYFFNACAILGAGFDVENCTYFPKIFLDGLLIHLSLILHMCFGSNHEKYNLLMPMLTDFLQPRVQSIQWLFIINCEC